MGTAISPELVHLGERRDRLGRRRYPAERRQQLLAAFRESGMTRRAFARREGMRYTTLCTWVEKEAKTAGQAEAVVRFAEVAVPAGASASLEVRLPDGTLLRGGDALELAALVRAVRS